MSKMIEFLQAELQPGMEISNIKEYNTKTKFSFYFDGEQIDKCEISNTCAPNYERDFCRSVINNIVSKIYINKGNLEEAKEWLSGRRWNSKKSKKNQKENIRWSMDCKLSDKR